MKKFTLPLMLLFALSYNALSQCTEPFSLPYLEDAESAAIPELPNCVYSGYLTFASSEIFQTTADIEGFSDNVFVYNTAVNAMMPEGIGTAVTLGTPVMELNEGTSYTVSYKYGMSDPEGVIGLIRVMLIREGEYIYLPEQENVTAGIPSTFTSEPFTLEEGDAYSLTIEVHLLSNQGFLYFDDITLEEAPAASVQQNTFNNLTVYPNPVKNEINLTNANAVDNIVLYSLTGQKVLSQQVTNKDVTINTEGLSKGVYFLKAASGTTQKTIKIIKE
ncbi:T9SS type A sorting domain-containing protein [Flavobacterium sp. LaA7.5]|nr:T9SS type A sorting domain-containing protein [Flavobacterium salilacus subsp. altitudinum]